jgi:hypothetical protein
VAAVRVLGVDVEAAPHCEAERRPQGGEPEPLPCSWTEDGAAMEIALPECANLADGFELSWHAMDPVCG